MDNRDITAELSKYTSGFLRENFGKGPESVHVSINSNFIVIYIRNFLTPSEKVLLNQNREDRVVEIRDLVISSLVPEIKANINRITGMEVKEFYYDWGLHNKSGMFTCFCSKETKSKNLVISEFKAKKKMEREVEHLSRIAQKEPIEMVSYQLNNRTFLFIRNGILVSIEKELIRDGLVSNLKTAKRRLEKRLLHNNTHFEEYLDTRVIDIFVDWDFDLDKSAMVFITNPTS